MVRDARRAGTRAPDGCNGAAQRLRRSPCSNCARAMSGRGSTLILVIQSLDTREPMSALVKSGTGRVAAETDPTLVRFRQAWVWVANAISTRRQGAGGATTVG